MSRHLAFSSVLVAIVSTLQPPPTCLAVQPYLDPDALSILRATLGSIADAKAFSFQVVVSHDRLATNNQIVTYFNKQAVTALRPDKLRVDIDGAHHDVQFS